MGGHRHTIGHWLALYEAGGLEAVRAVCVPAGQPLSRPPGVLAAIAQALRQPAGFAADEALRQWVLQTLPLEGNYHTLYPVVRTRIKAQREGPRPTHAKQP